MAETLQGLKIRSLYCFKIKRASVGFLCQIKMLESAFRINRQVSQSNHGFLAGEHLKQGSSILSAKGRCDCRHSLLPSKT